MREILFKAKRVDDGEWVYGNFVKTLCDDGEYHYCITNGIVGEWVEVIPLTVCQYINRLDKNNKKVFTNDILKDEQGKVYKVAETADGWKLHSEKRKTVTFTIIYKLEIIGNIFEKEKGK